MNSYVSQWVARAERVSSQYSTRNSYGVGNIIGPPTVFPKYGDKTGTLVLRTYGTWWKEEGNVEKICPAGQMSDHAAEDYVEVGFEETVVPDTISVYETYNPGAIVRILAFGYVLTDDEYANVRQGDGASLLLDNRLLEWRVLWKGLPTAATAAPVARKFSPPLSDQVRIATRVIRLEFNSEECAYYTELDAISLRGWRVSALAEAPGLGGNTGDTLPPDGLSLDQLALEDTTTQPYEAQPTVTSSAFAGPIPRGSGGPHLSRLPFDLIIAIASYLPIRDRIALSETCRYVHSSIHDSPDLWRTLDFRPFWHRLTPHTASVLGTRSSRLLRLSLAWCPQITDFTPFSFHHLQVLDMSCHWALTDAMLGVICADAPVLFSLRLDRTNITDAALAMVGLRCPLLTQVCLRNCPRITAHGIKLLSDSTPNLRHIDYSHSMQVVQHTQVLRYPNGSDETLPMVEIASHDALLRYIAPKWPHLVSIDLWRAGELGSALGILAESCPLLQTLDLGWCHIPYGFDLARLVVARLPRLRKLFLTAMRLHTDSVLNHIGSEIRQLDLLGNSCVTSAVLLKNISRWPHLDFLDVSFCGLLTDDVLVSISAMNPSLSIKKSFS